MDHQKTGALIAQTRKEKGLTQKELAQRLHISDRAVSKWERGAGSPDISLIEPLSQALELTVSELLRGEREAEDQGMTVQEAVKVLGQEWHRQMVRLRRIGRWALIVLACCAVLLFIASIPSKAPHMSYQRSIFLESYLGGSFPVPLKSWGSSPGPGTEYFVATLSPQKVVDRILEQPQAVSAVSWRIPEQADSECWLITVRNQDGMAGYAFLSGHKEGWRWSYCLNEASDHYDGDIPFPSYLLSDSGWPTYFSDGEAVLSIFQEEELQTAFQILRVFYLGEGCTSWYDVQVDEENLSFRVAPKLTLWSTFVRRSPFQVSLLVQDGQVYFRLDP